jgi:hypothetical protein
MKLNEKFPNSIRPNYRQSEAHDTGFSKQDKESKRILIGPAGYKIESFRSRKGK